MVSTPLKHMLVKMGSASPIFGVKITHIWNHQAVLHFYHPWNLQFALQTRPIGPIANSQLPTIDSQGGIWVLGKVIGSYPELVHELRILLSFPYNYVRNKSVSTVTSSLRLPFKNSQIFGPILASKILNQPWIWLNEVQFGILDHGEWRELESLNVKTEWTKGVHSS